MLLLAFVVEHFVIEEKPCLEGERFLLALYLQAFYLFLVLFLVKVCYMCVDVGNDFLLLPEISVRLEYVEYGWHEPFVVVAAFEYSRECAQEASAVRCLYNKHSKHFA